MDFFSFCALFAFALLGGIPRATCWSGLLFWLAWMATQAAQFTTCTISILFELASYLGVRQRFGPCLVTVNGWPLLDLYAMATFAVQPPILIKFAMAFAYSYLFTLGLLVFDGSRRWPWHRHPAPRPAARRPQQWRELGGGAFERI